MTIQTIKRNISKLLIVVLAAMLMIAFIPGDVQAGLDAIGTMSTADSWLENMYGDNTFFLDEDGRRFEDSIYYVDAGIRDPLPTWEEYTTNPNYGYVSPGSYVSLTDYVAAYPADTYDGYIVRIDNAQELFDFSLLVNRGVTEAVNLPLVSGHTTGAIAGHFLGLHYVLGNNINWRDKSGYTFEPIGRAATPFVGTFDGQGFEISNLVFATDVGTLNDHMDFAFFSRVGTTGVVTMFGLMNPTIDVRATAGTIRVAGICGVNEGSIEYVYVAQTDLDNLGYRVDRPGGVAGLVYENTADATFKNAYYTGTVIAAGSTVLSSTPVYPVYVTNRSENTAELWYNCDETVGFWRGVRTESILNDLGIENYTSTVSTTISTLRTIYNNLNSTGATLSNPGALINYLTQTTTYQHRFPFVTDINDDNYRADVLGRLSMAIDTYTQTTFLVEEPNPAYIDETETPDEPETIMVPDPSKMRVRRGDLYTDNRNIYDALDPGTVQPMKRDDMLWRRYGLTDVNWRRRDYRSINATLTSIATGGDNNFELSTYPGLSGFSGDLRETTQLPYQTIADAYIKMGSSSTYPLTLLKPADLIYFTEWISSGGDFRPGTSTLNSNILDRYFALRACIDMSSVAPDAFAYRNPTSDPNGFNPNAFTGTFTGSGTHNSDCTCAEHITTHSSGSSHSILNLQIIKRVRNSVGSHLIGFIPISKGTVQRINFIGGLCSPDSFVEDCTTNPLATYLMGTVTGHFSGNAVEYIASSMDIIVPDGPAMKLCIGGLIGQNDNTVRYSSFSGCVSGGVHPYNADVAPASSSSANPRNRYLFGGITGIYGNSTDNTNLGNTNFGQIEGCAFYNIPNDAIHATVGTAVGGISGAYDNAQSGRSCINWGDVYAVPVDPVTKEPRKGPATVEEPDGARAYAISPLVGGWAGFSSTIGNWYNYISNIAAGNSNLNYGTVTVENAIGSVWVGGLVARAHWTMGRAANFGNIIVKNNYGSYLYVGGSHNAAGNGGGASAYLLHNYGDITVDDTNTFTQIAVGGVYTTIGSEAHRDVYNFGEVNVVNNNPDCTYLRVAGVCAAQGTISAAVFNLTTNYGAVNVETNQLTGTIGVSGVSEGVHHIDIANGNSDLNGGVRNFANITVDATGNGSAVLHVGGVKGYTTTYTRTGNCFNTGDITVTSSGSGAVYVGGLATLSNRALRNVNTGIITVTQLGTGLLRVGGITSANNDRMFDNTNKGSITVDTGRSTSVYVGGINGDSINSTYSTFSNTINYGDIAVTSPAADIATPLIRVAGISGSMHLRANGTVAMNEIYNTGLVNHGNIDLQVAAADKSTSYIAGIAASFTLTANNTRINGFINYGSITSNTPETKRAGIINVYSWTTNYSGMRFTNFLNTDSNVSMFGTNYGTTANVTNASAYTFANLITTNPNDPMISGGSLSTQSTTNMFGGKVTYMPDGIGTDTNPGIYHETSPLRDPKYGGLDENGDEYTGADSRDNVSIAYADYDYVAEWLQPNFPEGMYAVVNSTYTAAVFANSTPFDINLEFNAYLPFYTYTGSYSSMRTFWRATWDPTAPNTWTTVTWNDWWTESGAKDAFDSCQQVNVPLNILTMAWRSVDYAPNGLLAPSAPAAIARIQQRPDKTTLEFFYTEDLLGLNMYIHSLGRTAGSTVWADEACTIPFGDIRIQLPATYSDGVTPLEDMELSLNVWLRSADGSETLKFDILFHYLPNPKWTIRRLSFSGAPPLDNPKLTAASTHWATTSIPAIGSSTGELERIDEVTYVMNRPVHWLYTKVTGEQRWADSVGIFNIGFDAYDLSETFFLNNCWEITYDNDGVEVDVSNRFSISDYKRFEPNGTVYYEWLWENRYSNKTGGYLSGSVINAAAPTTKYMHVFTNQYNPPGWYTLTVQVQETVLLRIKFRFASPVYGRLTNYSTNVGGRYSVPASLNGYGVGLTETIDVAQNIFLYTMTNTTYGNTNNRHLGAGDHPVALYGLHDSTFMRRYVIDATNNADGTHTYTTLLAVSPQRPPTREDNDTITWWTMTGGENDAPTVTQTLASLTVDGITRSFAANNTYTLLRDSLPHRLTYTQTYGNTSTTNAKISYIVTLNGEELTCISSASPYQYQKDGKTVFTLTASGNNRTIDIPASAPAGSYVIQPHYYKTQDVTVYNLPDGYTWPQGNTYGSNDAAFGPYITVGADGYPSFTSAVTTRVETLVWDDPICTPVTIVKPMNTDSYIIAMQFPGAVRGVLDTIPPFTPVNPIMLASNGTISYNSIVREGASRVKYFEYTLNISPSAVSTNYQPQFRLPGNATLWIRYDEADAWVFATDTGVHTADYSFDPEIGKTIYYRVVAEDGIEMTYYQVKLLGPTRNNDFILEPKGVGDLAGNNLQKYFNGMTTGSVLDLYVRFSRWDDALQQGSEVYGAAYHSNTNFLLPYTFPLQAEGVYRLYVSLPDELEFYLTGFVTIQVSREYVDEYGWGVGQYIVVDKNTVEFYIDEGVTERETTFTLNIKRRTVSAAPARLGVSAEWESKEALTFAPDGNGDYTFINGGTNPTYVIDFNNDYDETRNAANNKIYIMSPTGTGSLLESTRRYNAYFNGTVTIEAGVTVVGNIYSTGNIIVNGTVDGNVYSHKQVTRGAGGIITGSTNGYSWTLG